MAKKYKLTRINRAVSEKQADESNFKINYRTELNPAQYEAASAVNGAYLVIAGAGTGKTRTLVYRVARLIELGYSPDSILLLTFTRKAAREMMDRAAMLLDSRCSKINGGTFHSFANLTLRKYAKYLGLDNNFTILDQGDSEDVINLIRGQIDLGAEKKRFPKKNTIFKVISLSKNTGRALDDIIFEDYPHFKNFIDRINDIRRVYEDYKAKNSLLDYDDLLVYLIRFLRENSPAAKNLLAGIKFVMVDEYQDTNKLQADLVKELTRTNNNIMVVGDDSQSIYSFRGASFKNIMEFPSLFERVQIIKLEENYRSTQEILDFTNFIIKASVEKYDKELYTRKSGGELPGIISASNDNMQSKFIVERILELRDEGVELNDVAVLFRSSYHSFDLEIELNKANIPYVKFGGMKFMETAHVKDVISFLRIVNNPRDIISWYRILLLHEGIGPKKAQSILDELERSNLDIKRSPDEALAKRYNDKISHLFYFLNGLHKTKDTPSERAAKVLNYYDPIFRGKYDDFNKRRKDLDIFLNIAENYRSHESFLSDLALEPPSEAVADVNAGDKEDELLTLSTIHSAKGLEWDTVFIIHAVDGFFPSSQSFEDIESMEEERRLMYVASTRAKNHLYITYPMNIFERHSGTTYSKPSRFIIDVGDELAEEWLLEEDF